MAVLRVNKTSNYTVMSNYHFKEKEMSLKAKGLLSLMLSLPDTWDYSINGLVAICKESETAINSTLKELKDFGYLVISKVRNGKGQYEYVYNIYEQPHLQETQSQEVESPEVEKPGVENPGVENIGQYNTNKSNIKKINKKEINKENNYFENAEINSLFTEFLELRKKLKAVNSDRAIKMLINKLNKYDDEVKREMIERSILNSWKDVYEIKQHNKSTNDFSGVAEAIRERSKAEEHDEEFYKNLNF